MELNMLTASELGMLCAKHRIKSASDLTEGVRSWFTPKPPTPPEMNITKDQKPQTQPNPYAKSSEQPFSAAKGLPKANPKQPITPFASGSAKAQEAAQAAARPQYDYFRPPTGHVKTQIIPYDYFKPLYDKYPGGYQQAIDDSQRWQEHAKLEGLQTWKPEDLHQPVEVRGGNFVGPWESRQFLSKQPVHGFTSPTDPFNNVKAYASSNLNGNHPRGRGAIMLNPNKVDAPASDPELRGTYGHELTHEMHRRNNYLDDNVFKGHESKFPEHLSRGPAGIGTNNNPQSRLDYFGDPTEFGAHLNELRRHWIENNPGKALNSIPAAEALLHHYNPAREVEERYYEMTVPDNDITYNSAYPRSPANYGDHSKTLSPSDRLRAQKILQHQYDQSQNLFQARKASGVPDGYKKIYLDSPGYEPVPHPSSIQRFLPTIMSDPKLKQKAILQILSSVVQNKQRQAPGTNV
jgi:hypothetical protein